MDREGLGALLMKHALRRCDEQGSVAYLESSNPRNISLYERHGFKIIGRIQSGSSPGSDANAAEAALSGATPSPSRRA